MRLTGLYEQIHCTNALRISTAVQSISLDHDLVTGFETQVSDLKKVSPTVALAINGKCAREHVHCVQHCLVMFSNWKCRFWALL